MIALMFVGASPGSTGGGIKTTTFAVLLGAFRALVRGEADVTMFSRRLSQDTVLRSASVALAALTAALVGLMLLLATQPIAFERLAFETFSALGTVGLSLGVTPMLDTFGKFVIMALMFLGRVGPVTVALLFGSSRPRRVRYPEARLMVG
jgi:trk system potassium uptake protein TrkH